MGLQYTDTLKALYREYEDTNVTEAAKLFCKWTVATLLSADSTNNGKRTNIEKDYQSLGALLLNTGASKLTQALFPEHTSFFAFQETDATVKLFAELEDAKGDVTSFLNELGRNSSALVHANAGYSQTSYATKLLMATGNALIFRDTESQKFITYNILNYVCKRDGTGELLHTILRENVAIQSIEDEALKSEQLQKGKKLTDSIELYTSIRRVTRGDGEGWEVTQELDTKPIGEASYYPLMLCPYRVLTWNLVVGENYGRGLVEEYAGYFGRMSALSEQLLLYEVEAMKLINLVSAREGADVDALTTAETGQYVQADGAGVVAHEGGTANKIQVILADIDQVFGVLSKAFLYTGNTRQAERVTAEEIRMLIQETNVNLMGNMAHLAQEWLTPLAYILSVEYNPKVLAPLTLGGFKLSILVGSGAVNKSISVDRLMLAVQAITQIVPALTQLSGRFDPDRVIDKILDSFNIPVSELVFTEEELREKQAAQDEEQQQQQQQLADPELMAQQQGII